MTRFDDDLESICTWGRWRIGPARNEPMPHMFGERRAHPLRGKPPEQGVPRIPLRRGRAWLRLVIDAGAGGGIGR